MTLFMDLPSLLRQIMMIMSFLCFSAIFVACVVFIRKRKFAQTVICFFGVILGYCCLQVMMAVARMFAMNIRYEGFSKRLAELPAVIVITGFMVFMLLSLGELVPAVRILKNECTFPHFSKLKVQLHDTFGLSLVAIKAYYDGQNIDKDTVKTLFSKCGECFGNNDLFMCRTYESIYEIGRLIGVSLNVNGTLPEDEKIKPMVCAVLSECMINTFSHAWGDTVSVDISDAKGTVIIIRNNGRISGNAISEKGGLKHLRELVELSGGSMIINGDSNFSLTLSLPQEGIK